MPASDPTDLPGTPVDFAPPPSLLAYTLAYLAIGVGVIALAKLVFKRDTKVGLMVAAIAVVLHHKLDAPLARKLVTWSLIPGSRASERPNS